MWSIEQFTLSSNFITISTNVCFNVAVLIRQNITGTSFLTLGTICLSLISWAKTDWLSLVFAFLMQQKKPADVLPKTLEIEYYNLCHFLSFDIRIMKVLTTRRSLLNMPLAKNMKEYQHIIMIQQLQYGSSPIKTYMAAWAVCCDWEDVWKTFKVDFEVSDKKFLFRHRKKHNVSMTLI